MSIDLRNRIEALAGAIDLGLAARADTNPAFLGQIVDGGAMPTGSGRFYLVNPVALDGEEAEGGTATAEADTTREIPVIVLGTRQVVVGDLLVCRQVNGRWFAESGHFLNYCNPTLSACGSNRYSANGTVTDLLNATNALIYRYEHRAWFTDWLPCNRPPGVGGGPSYYYLKLAVDGTTGKPVASLVALAGTFLNTSTYAPYPAIFGKPWALTTSPSLVTYTSTGDPTDCDPLAYAATWSGPYAPITSATYSVPKWELPTWGFSCGTPCPLPRKDLTLSWANVTSGNGSGTLVYNSAAKTWAMACTSWLRADLSMISGGSIAFNLRRYGSPSDCSGAVSLWSYGVTLTLDADYTCEPLLLTFRPRFTTQALYTSGYRTFVITE